MVLDILVVHVSIVDSESVSQCMEYIGFVADGRNYLYMELKTILLMRA